MASNSQPIPQLTPQQVAIQAARALEATARCRSAWEEAYSYYRVDQSGARAFALQFGSRAYRAQMPVPRCAGDLPVYMACLLQAIPLQVFSDKEQSRLLYALQSAQKTFNIPPPDESFGNTSLYPIPGTAEAQESAPEIVAQVLHQDPVPQTGAPAKPRKTRAKKTQPASDPATQEPTAEPKPPATEPAPQNEATLPLLQACAEPAEDARCKKTGVPGPSPLGTRESRNLTQTPPLQPAKPSPPPPIGDSPNLRLENHTNQPQINYIQKFTLPSATPSQSPLVPQSPPPFPHLV